MEQIIKNTKLSQLIDKPTRTTSHSATLIDIIVTDSPALALHHDIIASPTADLIMSRRTLPNPRSNQKLKHSIN